MHNSLLSCLCTAGADWCGAVCRAGGHKNAQHSALCTLLVGCRWDQQGYTLQDAKARRWNVSKLALSGLQYLGKQQVELHYPISAKLCHVKGFLKIRDGSWDWDPKAAKYFLLLSHLQQILFKLSQEASRSLWIQKAEKIDTYVQKGC